MLQYTPGLMPGPSVEDWLVGALRERGPQTLEELGSCLPQTNWTQLLLAIDRLSRRGDITMRLHSQGDYLISLNSPPHHSPAYPNRAA